MSYDGRLGERGYGRPLPARLDLTLVEIEAGRSSQATLPGRDEMTVESLYLSRALAEELAVRPALHRHRRDEQMQTCRNRKRPGRGWKYHNLSKPCWRKL